MSFASDLRRELSGRLPEDEAGLRAELMAFLLEDGDLEPDLKLLEQEACKKAFLRGAFLNAGTFTDPEKSYSLEFVFRKAETAKLVKRLLADFGIPAKTVERNSRHVVYLKNGDAISDFLALTEASRTLFAYENARVVKDIRNSINRIGNCDAANSGKAARAGAVRIREIQHIIETKGIEYIPEPLRETALLRVENPDVTIRELGEMMDPPVGKSGVNHRLRKLKEIADELQ